MNAAKKDSNSLKEQQHLTNLSWQNGKPYTTGTIMEVEKRLLEDNFPHKQVVSTFMIIPGSVFLWRSCRLSDVCNDPWWVEGASISGCLALMCHDQNSTVGSANGQKNDRS